MSKIHCTVVYHKYGSSVLDTFAGGVSNGIYTNPSVFVNPPFTQDEFDKERALFNAASSDYDLYGAVKKTAFVSARKKLIDALDVQADYVDGIANGDASIILLSGLIPSLPTTSTNAPLEKINAFTVKRVDAMVGIAVEIPAIIGYGPINYGCIVSEGAPLSVSLMNDGQIMLNETTGTVRFDFNKGRKKTFKSLTVGITYYVYVFAINSVSVSPLSDAKTIMAAS
jgi:hypothetical protein